MTAVMEDIYHSRIDGSWETVVRRDPVVYPDLKNAEDGPLSQRQLESFERDGFILLPGLVGEDRLAQLVREAARLETAVPEGDERRVSEPDSRAVRSIFGIHEISSVYRRFCAEPDVAGVARQILNDEVYIHQSRINYKPGFEGRDFYWHSDFETWHVEDGLPRMRTLSCVVALTESNEFNGPLMLIPGSHKYFIRCEGETPEEHYKKSLKKQELGAPPREALRKLLKRAGRLASMKGKAGTVLFFDCNVMHGSAGNITPWPRHNLFFVFNSVHNRLARPYCGLEPRPTFVANREIEPVSRF